MEEKIPDVQSEENNLEDNVAEEKVTFVEKIKRNPWILSTIILGVGVLILLFLIVHPVITGGVVGGKTAGEKFVDYINSDGEVEISYVSSEDMGDFYKVNVLYQGQEIPVFVTKDGKYYTSTLVPITDKVAGGGGASQTNQEITKSDKPKVELFVMTHCPYGTQAEKGLIPVLKTLGDKIDSSIRFVHYFMHGDKEEQETKRQVCIREEQGEKYLDYLACFLEDGDSDRCQATVGVDKKKLNSCVANKADEYYETDSVLSEGYGVRGSPTLIINGQIVSSGRSPAAYLDTICSAFNTEPSECDLELDSATPSPGFGYGEGSSSSGQC